MPSSRLSDSSTLTILATILASIGTGFGINAILRPAHAMEFFEFKNLAVTADPKLIEGLMIVYGIRDVFMGLAICAAAFFGSRKTCGVLLMLSGMVAVGDGVACKMAVGRGEWSHWGYVPVMALVGTVMMGAFDRA